MPNILLDTSSGIPLSLLNQVTATPSDVIAGKKFIDASGNLVTGTGKDLHNIKMGTGGLYYDRNANPATHTIRYTAPSDIICGSSGIILRELFFNYSAQTRTVVREVTASYSGNIGTVVYRKISNQEPNEIQMSIPFFYIE